MTVERSAMAEAGLLQTTEVLKSSAEESESSNRPCGASVVVPCGHESASSTGAGWSQEDATSDSSSPTPALLDLFRPAGSGRTRAGRRTGAVSKPTSPPAGEESGNAQPSDSGRRVQRSTSRVVLAHSHEHAQWRTIAEEFSTLLVPEFVDVVFKVRGKPGFLAAHKALVAAAWPILREDLKKLQGVPSLELRSAGLHWADISDDGDSPRWEGGDVDHSSSVQLAASPERERKSYVGRLLSQGMHSQSLGVFDVSGRMWGSYSIMQGLLCHLYSKPVITSERELTVLRVAALNLGCLELARSCDDVRPSTISRGMKSRPSSPESEPSVTLAMPVSGSRCLTPVRSEPSSTNASGMVTSPQKVQIARPAEEVVGSDAGTSAYPPTPGQRDSVAEALATPVRPRSPPDDGCPVVLGPDQAAKQGQTETLEGCSVTIKPQRSFPDRMVATVGGIVAAEPTPDRNNGERPETGGVRRILSEIKRQIVESSRIIADQTFQQIYEMVPGQRGILGEGINGPVRMAKHRKNGREVAVKRISCVNLSEQRRQMLVSEVRIFLQVSHRNIVQLLEVYESEVDQAVLLVMELCTGRELFERLAERRWYSEYDAARVARQMLDAVAYLHSQSICHRDLKLENWLYESPHPDARLKLCDFGFGQIVVPSVQLTATLGSLFYVAPEVLEGSYGLPCDMWSVGVIVYMLLSGVPPFDGKTDAEVVAKIRQGRFSTGKRWEGISESAKHFVRSLLRKDPDERMPAAEATQHAWLKMESQPKVYSWPKGCPDPELELSIDRGVIRDMWKFAQNNAVTRAALGILGKHSSSFGGQEEDVLLLENKLKLMDEQGTGKVAAEVFIQVLKECLHGRISDADEKLLFDRIAADMPDGANESDASKVRRRREVNYREFISLTKARRMANNTAAIREVFKVFDTCGDGFIKEDDMHSLLGHEFKSTIDNYVGVNGKDLIDYKRFANHFSQEIAKKDEQEPPLPQENSSSAIGENDRSEVTGLLENRSPSSGASTLANPTSASTGVPRSGSEMKPEREAETKVAAHTHKGGHHKGDCQSDEECDADAQSDEEQLLNVKKMNTTDFLQDDLALVDDRPKRDASALKANLWSFSLSLAGSSEYDDSFGVNRVLSLPSDVYGIKQLPHFHSKILRPFYAARPVSNVVMGLIRGTSLYAKQAVMAKLATIIHTACGYFFIMPNPKYHTEVDSRKGLLSKETGKFRFVAWWIHPRFSQQLRQWFERLTVEGHQTSHESWRESSRRAASTTSQGPPADLSPWAGDDGFLSPEANTEAGQRNARRMSTSENKAPADAEGPDIGSPGDFRFSDVPKPENYLHTYRDLQSRDHVNMLTQLQDGTHRFLRSLFDENFLMRAQISAGFHYPVRTQYATLHMQLRVNSGPVCREDGRGVDVERLIELLKRDRLDFERDAETFRYHVTENVKVSLLAAAREYEEQNPGQSTCRQTGPLAYELGFSGMPTIHDEGEEEEEGSDPHQSHNPSYDEQIIEKNEDLTEAENEAVEASAVAAATAAAAACGSAVPMSPGKLTCETAASYLVNLQPKHGSRFHEILLEHRQRCMELYGPDPTYLYPLHVSVTGFFEADTAQIQPLVAGMKELLWCEAEEQQSISVGKVLSTPSGYVLFDMKAPSLTRFAQRLGFWSSSTLGVHIRPKAVNHISLASNRPEEDVREAIRSLYDPEGNKTFEEVYLQAQFDLVLSRLVLRSSFEQFVEDGPHRFEEVCRIPVQSPVSRSRLSSFSAQEGKEDTCA